MALAIQISVVFPLFFAISLRWNDDLHPGGYGVGNDFVRIITPISQQCFGGYSLDQMDSFFAISSGTLCNKYSDRHTICIHGKVNFGCETVDTPYPISHNTAADPATVLPFAKSRKPR